MSTGVRETLSTVQVAQALGISQKLLLKLQKVKNSPFWFGTKGKLPWIDS